MILGKVDTQIVKVVIRSVNLKVGKPGYPFSLDSFLGKNLKSRKTSKFTYITNSGPKKYMYSGDQNILKSTAREKNGGFWDTLLSMLVFIDFFYQNRFINECPRKKKQKSQSPGITEFFVICR